MDDRDTLRCLPEDLDRHGEAPALLVPQGDEVHEVSYRRLADDTRDVARTAVALGIERGEHVALLAGAGPAWITVCLGLLRAGAVPVPLDTQIEDEPLERVLHDANVAVVLADEGQRERLAEIDVEARVLRIDDRSSWPRALEGREPKSDADLPEAPSADDVALLFFTSGTTGPPKGVPLRQRHLRFQVDAVEDTDVLVGDDRLLLPLPLHHVYPLVIGVLVPLSLGASIVLPESLSGADFLRAVERTGSTIIIGVPRLYAGLRESLEARIRSAPWPVRLGLRGVIGATTRLRATTGLNAGRALLKPLRRRLGEELRVLASGGSPLDPDLGRFLQGLGFDVTIGYGLTETAPLLTINPPGTRRMASVGPPLPDVDLRIDPDATEREGDVGEILARGPGVFSGYLNLDEETRESFTDDGWYRTGDLGRFDDDGYLYVQGRMSTMIVTASGENLRTEAVEEAYAEHDLIAEIGVLQVDAGLAAVVRPEPSEVNDASESVVEAVATALDEASRSMPSYQRLDTHRVTSKPLERTRLGKIRRHKLRERFEALGEDVDEAAHPIPVEDMSARDRELLRDDTTRRVWDLLARRFPDQPLEPDSDIRMQLGIDSLGWLDLSMDIARETGVELREEQIARIDTVRDLLEIAGESHRSDGDPDVPLAEPESVLTDEQQRWLERPTAARRRAARVAWGSNRLAMRAAFRVRASGTENLEGSPLVFAPNHTSFLDPFVVGATLPTDVLVRTHWGGWTGYTLRNRVFRAVSRLIGVVPVDPERSMISSLAFGVAALRRDRHLVWFPEGERSRDGELGRLRPGIGALLETVDDARVVPVAIDGAFEAWPPHHRWPRPRRLAVRYGEPLSAEELERRGEGDSRRDRIVDGLGKVMAEMVRGSRDR